MRGNWNGYDGVDPLKAQWSFGTARQIGQVSEDVKLPKRGSSDFVSFATTKIKGTEAEDDSEPRKWTYWDNSQEEERIAVRNAVLITFFCTLIGTIILAVLVIYCAVYRKAKQARAQAIKEMEDKQKKLEES